MSRAVPAIYEAGVFRPLQPVDLAQGTHVEIQVPTGTTTENAEKMSPEDLARQQAAIQKMLAEIESLPVEGPDDGFSGRDHDKVLYGKP